MAAYRWTVTAQCLVSALLLAEYEAEQKSLTASASDAELHLSSFEEDTGRAAQIKRQGAR